MKLICKGALFIKPVNGMLRKSLAIFESQETDHCEHAIVDGKFKHSLNCLQKEHTNDVVFLFLSSVFLWKHILEPNILILRREMQLRGVKSATKFHKTRIHISKVLA